MTQSQPRQPPTDLAPIDTATAAIALVPQSLDGAMQLARWLATSSFLPEELRGKEGNIFAIVLAGAELGLPPMAALRGMYVVNGRTALEAKTKAAICIQRGAALYFRRTEHTAAATTWETLRRGETEPRSYRYTKLEAETAGLTGKAGPWKQYTQRMISHRALGWLCDDAYPDVVLGVATAEDFVDSDEVSFQPIASLAGGVAVGTLEGAKTARPAAATDAQRATVRDPTPTQGAASVAGAVGDKAAAKAFVEGKPILTEDDEIELITAIGNCGSERALREVAARIAGKAMTADQRSRLLKAHDDHLLEIRAAEAAERAAAAGKAAT